jgi:hypothetical protein
VPHQELVWIARIVTKTTGKRAYFYCVTAITSIDTGFSRLAILSVVPIERLDALISNPLLGEFECPTQQHLEERTFCGCAARFTTLLSVSAAQ